eukprot:1885635-Pleurochrysis_carterae.AAC.1
MGAALSIRSTQHCRFDRRSIVNSMGAALSVFLSDFGEWGTRVRGKRRTSAVSKALRRNTVNDGLGF